MTAPEVPNADLIATLRDRADWAYLTDPDEAQELMREAADALAALGDTVTRASFDVICADADKWEDRAVAAEAKLGQVRRYAEDRSYHHRARKDSVVGSWRVADDLLAILDKEAQ